MLLPSCKKVTAREVDASHRDDLVGRKSGTVPVSSSVADFTIPLVSSVRIGLASRVCSFKRTQDPVLSVNQSGVIGLAQAQSE